MGRTCTAYNVRVCKRNGKFVFDESCFMTRLAKRGKGYEWVGASERDKRKLKEQLKI
jgi:hypothetical protein